MIRFRRSLKRMIFYYALLTVVMFVAFFMANYAGIVSMSSSQLSPFKWVLLFIWYMAFLWAGDTLIKRLRLIK